MKKDKDDLRAELVHYLLEIRVYLIFANKYELKAKERPKIAKRYKRAAASLRIAAAELSEIHEHLDF